MLSTTDVLGFLRRTTWDQLQLVTHDGKYQEVTVDNLYRAEKSASVVAVRIAPYPRGMDVTRFTKSGKDSWEVSYEDWSE